MSTSEDLRKLSAEIISNPEKVLGQMTDEEIINLRKYIHPMGNIIREKKEYAVMSVINYREDWFKKFYVTSLIGFLYTLADEFEPSDELFAQKREYEKFKETDAYKAMSETERTASNNEARAKELALTKVARGLIKRFLNRNFEYDPSRHVRAAHKAASDSGTKSSEVPTSADQVKDKCSTADAASRVLDSIDRKRDRVLDYLKNGLGEGYNLINSAKGHMATAVDLLAAVHEITTSGVSDSTGTAANNSDLASRAESVQVLLMKNYLRLSSVADDIAKLSGPISAAETAAALAVNPPAEVFHNFTRYISSNYEELTRATAGLYDAVTDLEFSVIFYKSFKNEDDAKQYLRVHESEFRVEPTIVENSGVTLLGPFTENRERADFYTKNAEILKRMDDTRAQEQKLGIDIMEKRVKNAKTESIRENGPDAPGLAAYTKALSTVSELGAKKLLTSKERDALETARAIKDDWEVPEDAIQVDMFYTQGEGEEARLARSKFYTQAEAPLHMVKDSEYSNAYQPKRQEGESVSDGLASRKMVKGRDGSVVNVRDLKK